MTQNFSASTLALTPRSVGEVKSERIQSAFVDSREDTDVLKETSKGSTVATVTGIPGRGIRLRPPSHPQNLMTFVIEQKWQGYVTDVDGDRFNAIVEQSSDRTIVEQVIFERSEVPAIMQSYIQEGAVFFWNIGFQVDPAGTHTRQSLVTFPMVPIHTEAEHHTALARARRRFRELGWGNRGIGSGDKSANTAEG